MILDKLVLYFEYPFVRYALAAGVLIALCSSLIGVTLGPEAVFFHRRWPVSCGIWCSRCGDDI